MKHARISLMLAAGMLGSLPALSALAQSQDPSQPPITTPRPPSSGRKAIPAPPVRPVPIDAALRKQAHDVLVAFTSDSNVVLRANAIEGVERTLEKEEAKALALRALSDPESLVRFSACIAVGDLKYADTHPILLKLAYDPSANVRLAARYGLHKLGDTALSQEILMGLRDDRPPVRAYAVMLLGMLGEKSAIKSLQHLSRDSSPSVRLQLSEALWRLGDVEALDNLVAGTISKYPDDQIVSLVALAQPRNPKVIKHILGLLVADFPEVELAAARAAGMLGVDEGMGIALKYADSKEPRQRSLSALALGEIRRSDGQDALRALLADPVPDVRLAAATAILKLREPGAQ